MRTSGGHIAAEFVVNCGGMWARKIGAQAGVDVPLQAAEHYYLISEAAVGIHPRLPILARDPDNAALLPGGDRKDTIGHLRTGCSSLARGRRTR